eukprot:350655-Chlamydomonas_euryale.AAC.6
MGAFNTMRGMQPASAGLRRLMVWAGIGCEDFSVGIENVGTRSARRVTGRHPPIGPMAPAPCCVGTWLSQCGNNK